MRRTTALILCTVAVLVAIAVIAGPRPTRAVGRGTEQGTPSATPTISPCVPEFNKVAWPRQVILGEETTITLTAKALCPSAVHHVVLVLEESSLVPSDDQQAMQAAAVRLVDALQLDAHPNDRVGVVAFAGMARTLCDLTGSAAEAKRCIGGLNFNGPAAIDTGLRQGLKVLVEGRPRGAAVAGDPLEQLVLFSTGRNDTGCTSALSAASQVKAQRVLLVAVCVGANCDEMCMRQIATSPRYYFLLADLPDLLKVVPAPYTGVRRMTITDTVPLDMAYVAGSADPVPDRGDPTTGWQWTFYYVPSGGVTVTFRVKPLETGERPTNLEATGELQDATNVAKRWVFPVPHVSVLNPAPLATATTTATAQPSLTPSPSATIGSKTATIYLPNAQLAAGTAGRTRVAAEP